MTKIKISILFIVLLMLFTSVSFADNGYIERTSADGKIIRTVKTVVTINQIKPIGEKLYFDGRNSIHFGLQYSETATSSSSTSLTVTADSFFYKAAVSFDLTNSQAWTVGTSYTFDIVSGSAGLYQMQVVFPGSRAEYRSYRDGGGLIWKRDITFAPDDGDRYLRIGRVQ